MSVYSDYSGYLREERGYARSTNQVDGNAPDRTSDREVVVVIRKGNPLPYEPSSSSESEFTTRKDSREVSRSSIVSEAITEKLRKRRGSNAESGNDYMIDVQARSVRRPRFVQKTQTKVVEYFGSEDGNHSPPLDRTKPFYRSGKTAIERPQESREKVSDSALLNETHPRYVARDETVGTNGVSRERAKLFEQLDGDVALFEKENDLKFENALRRMCMSSGISADLFEQIITAHNEKQLRKSRLRNGEPLDNVQELKEGDPASMVQEDEAESESEDSASTVQLPSHQKKRPSTAAGMTGRDKIAKKVIARIIPSNSYRHKIDIPPQTSSVLIAGPTGYVEFQAADGMLRHTEVWGPNDERPMDLPDAPSPPAESQAVEHKPKSNGAATNLKEELIVELLKNIQRKLQTLGIAPAYQSDHDHQATVNSVIYSDEPENLDQGKGKQRVKQIAGPSQKRNKRPWKNKQRADAQEQVTVSA